MRSSPVPLKRLVVSGYPCSAEGWLRLFNDGVETKVIPFAEVLMQSRAIDFSLFADIIKDHIIAEKPTSIICHDFGVLLTLRAILKLRNKQDFGASRLTIFNGAVRGFDVLRNRHPFWIQCKSWDNVAEASQQQGCHPDAALKDLHPKVRALYRKVIVYSLLGKIVDSIYRRDLNLDLGIKSQIIASENDPYVALETVRRMQIDFNIKKFHSINYGHFPYAGDMSAIRNLVVEFENDSSPK